MATNGQLFPTEKVPICTHRSNIKGSVCAINYSSTFHFIVCIHTLLIFNFHLIVYVYTLIN